MKRGARGNDGRFRKESILLLNRFYQSGRGWVPACRDSPGRRRSRGPYGSSTCGMGLRAWARGVRAAALTGPLNFPVLDHHKRHTHHFSPAAFLYRGGKVGVSG